MKHAGPKAPNRAPNYNAEWSRTDLAGDIADRLVKRKGLDAAAARAEAVAFSENYEAAHLWGPGFGDEAAAGMLWAPKDVNQNLQNGFAEKFARDLQREVESGVGHAQKTPLKGLRFETLEEAQTYLDRWEERWADTRIHGTTKRQVATMFAEERPALLPLPVEPFRYYQHGERTVHLDGCVEVEAAYYGAPPGWIGRRVQVQWDTHQVRLLNPHTGELLREHLRHARGGHRIKDEDRPKQTPLSTQQLLRRAEVAGPHIGTLCEILHRTEGEAAVRRILGMLALAKKYGTASADDACAMALESGVCNYRFVRR